jgi:uncharacterized protein (DUF4415 family)
MKTSGKTNWDKLHTMTDKEIDYTDIASTNADFWNNPQSIAIHNKVKLSLQIDDDLANWIKQLGNSSDNTVNGILRSYYNTFKLLQKAQ